MEFSARNSYGIGFRGEEREICPKFWAFLLKKFVFFSSNFATKSCQKTPTLIFTHRLEWFRSRALHGERHWTALPTRHPRGNPRIWTRQSRYPAFPFSTRPAGVHAADRRPAELRQREHWPRPGPRRWHHSAVDSEVSGSQPALHYAHLLPPWALLPRLWLLWKTGEKCRISQGSQVPIYILVFRCSY